MRQIYYHFEENMQRLGRSKRIFFLLLLVFIASIPANAQMTATGEIRHIPAGSVIIDMGVTPQTINNGLKPYGLVYALVMNEKIPVIWSISATKTKDGTDFTVDGREFRGGSFIIEKEYAELPEIRKLLDGTKGAYLVTEYNKDGTVKNSTTQYFGPTVVTRYTTQSDVEVPIYRELRFFTQWTFDTDNGDIADGYLKDAGISLAATRTALPSALTPCHDLFVLPHADPKWTTHGKLYNWVRAYDAVDNPDGNGGWLWSGCHAPNEGVGIENMYNTATGQSAQRTNFLTERIDGGLIGTTASLTPGKTAPSNNAWHYDYPIDAPMQFIGKIDWVLNNGSGPGYRPTANHKWRDGAKIAVWDVANNGVRTDLVIYGYAYDNPNNGVVMYEAGHEYKGTTAADVAAKRIFLNFLFDGSTRKLPEFTHTSPALDEIELSEGERINFEVLAKGYGDADITYQWSQTSLNGTFSSTNTSSTEYTTESLPAGTLSKTGIITIIVTDPCGRSNVLTYPIIIKSKKNYWHGTLGDNDWAKAGNWTGNRVPNTYEDVEFATEANNPTVGGVANSGPAKEDLHLDQDRIIGNLINASEKDLVITTENMLTINGTVQDGNSNAGTIVVKADPANAKTGGTLIFVNPSSNTNIQATVEFYNKAYDCADCGFYRRAWQYFGIPVKGAQFYVAGSDNSRLQVATVPEFDNISLGFVPEAEGKYTLEFALSDDLKNTEIWLNDLVTDAKQRIMGRDSYTFEAKKGEPTTRFRLTRDANASQKPRISPDEQLIVVSATPDGRISIRNNSGKACSAFITDLRNTPVRRVEVNPGSEVIIDGVSKGIYLVRLQNSEITDVRRVNIK